MAKLQFVDLADLTTFKDLMDSKHAEQLTAATKDAIKSASVSSDGFTLFLYKTASPKSEDDAAYAIPLPNPSKKADKVSNAVDNNFASLDANGNLKDSGKSANSFDDKGAAKTVDDKFSTMIGTLPSQYTSIVDMITKTIASGVYDDTEVKAGIQANKDAIEVLSGSGDGSVKKQVADAVASIVADAPEAYDTLKEISDWISSHSTSASGMNTQINTNKQDIDNLKKLIGTLPETATAKTVVGYITEYVTNSITDLNMSQYATTAITDGLATRIGALEAKDVELKGEIDANAASIGSLSSTLTSSISSLQAAIDANTTAASNAQAKADANETRISTLEGIVGEGCEAIPIATIQGLFTAS